jgi:predicted aminopeptidase
VKRIDTRNALDSRYAQRVRDVVAVAHAHEQVPEFPGDLPGTDAARRESLCDARLARRRAAERVAAADDRVPARSA